MCFVFATVSYIPSKKCARGVCPTLPHYRLALPPNVCSLLVHSVNGFRGYAPEVHSSVCSHETLSVRSEVTCSSFRGSSRSGLGIPDQLLTLWQLLTQLCLLFVTLEDSLNRGLVTAIGIEDSRLLGCDAVSLSVWLPTFRKFAPHLFHGNSPLFI